MIGDGGLLMALLAATIIGSAASMLIEALERCDRTAERGTRAGRVFGSAARPPSR